MVTKMVAGRITNYTTTGAGARLQQMARDEQKQRGEPQVGLEPKTEARLKAEIQTLANKTGLAWRKTQKTTVARAKTQKSVKNMISYYAIAAAVNQDNVPVELIFNTDMTQLVYNAKGDQIEYVLLPKHTTDAPSQPSKGSSHMPQRIRLLVTVSAAGQAGPAILIKHMGSDELDGDEIKVIRSANKYVTMYDRPCSSHPPASSLYYDTVTCVRPVLTKYRGRCCTPTLPSIKVSKACSCCRWPHR